MKLGKKLFLFIIVLILFVSSFVSADYCGGTVQCQCGDMLIESQVMWYDLINCPIDGLIIGASYLASLPIGITTTIAVILHEIPQEIGDFGVLLHGGFSKNKALFYNFLTAITAILGAIASLFLSFYIENLTNFLIPFAAGGFIYIASSDLIPELHKEVKIKNSLLQFVAIVLGILVMIGLLYLE